MKLLGNKLAKLLQIFHCLPPFKSGRSLGTDYQFSRLHALHHLFPPSLITFYEFNYNFEHSPFDSSQFDREIPRHQRFNMHLLITRARSLRYNRIRYNVVHRRNNAEPASIQLSYCYFRRQLITGWVANYAAAVRNSGKIRCTVAATNCFAIDSWRGENRTCKAEHSIAQLWS